MSEAIFGLAGVVVGGLAVFGGSWIAARYEFKQQRLVLEKEAEGRREDGRNAWRERKLERYAPFLAAYYGEEARLVEIIEDLRSRRSGWEQRITETASDERRSDDLATLNRSLGWIGLLSEKQDTEALARAASTVFDHLITQLTEAREGAKKGTPVDVEPLEKTLGELRRIVGDLTKLLRDEVRPG